MSDIINQLIDLMNIGVAAIALFAGACVALLAITIGVHALGIRAQEDRSQRTAERRRALRGSESTTREAAS